MRFKSRCQPLPIPPEGCRASRFLLTRLLGAAQKAGALLRRAGFLLSSPTPRDALHARLWMHHTGPRPPSNAATFRCVPDGVGWALADSPADTVEQTGFPWRRLRAGVEREMGRQRRCCQVPWLQATKASEVLRPRCGWNWSGRLGPGGCGGAHTLQPHAAAFGR